MRANLWLIQLSAKKPLLEVHWFPWAGHTVQRSLRNERLGRSRVQGTSEIATWILKFLWVNVKWELVQCEHVPSCDLHNRQLLRKLWEMFNFCPTRGKKLHCTRGTVSRVTRRMTSQKKYSETKILTFEMINK